MLPFLLVSAAQFLEEGESKVVSNDLGDSYTVTRTPGTISITSNNEQSRAKLQYSFELLERYPLIDIEETEGED
ncbi:MAG: hypothetical protein ACKO24_08070 [Leptolyngbyaceae cyanobacterium]